jgi:hypothetical protein
VIAPVGKAGDRTFGMCAKQPSELRLPFTPLAEGAISDSG